MLLTELLVAGYDCYQEEDCGTMGCGSGQGYGRGRRWGLRGASMGTGLGSGKGPGGGGKTGNGEGYPFQCAPWMAYTSLHAKLNRVLLYHAATH